MQQIVHVARLRTAMAWGARRGPRCPAGCSRFLVGCHPRRWRERYGEEMLDVLDQYRPTARTVASLGASAVSAHLDPAYRTDRLSLSRLRRAALISAAIAAPLALVLAPFGYQVWQGRLLAPGGRGGPRRGGVLPALGHPGHRFRRGPRRHGHGMGRHGPEPAAAPVAVRGRPAHGASPDGRTVATVTFGRQYDLVERGQPPAPGQDSDAARHRRQHAVGTDVLPGRAPSACSGRHPACTRPRSATPAATRRTRPTRRSARAAPVTPRWCWSCSTRRRSRYEELLTVVLGEPRPDPGHAPGQRRRHAVPLGDLHDDRRAAAGSPRRSRDAYQRAPRRRPGYGADHDRDRAGRARSTTPRTTTSSTSTRTPRATAASAGPA